MPNGASIKDLVYLKSAFKNIISNFVLIVEVKSVKSRLNENITTFQIKLICKLTYCNKFYEVWKFDVRTTKLHNFIKVWNLIISILLLLLKLHIFYKSSETKGLVNSLSDWASKTDQINSWGASKRREAFVWHWGSWTLELRNSR